MGTLPRLALSLIVLVALLPAAPAAPPLEAAPAAQTISAPFSAEPFGASVDQSRAVAVGDLNGDGALDTVIGNGHHGYLNHQEAPVLPTAPSKVYFNDGRGGVAAVLPLPLYQGQLNTTTSVALGDLNGDGALDIVLGGAIYITYRYTCRFGDRSSTSLVYLNDGSGGFLTPTPISVDLPITSVALGDFDGDGALDLAAASYGFLCGPSRVYLNRNDGSGGFREQPVVLGASDAQSVALGDLDGDGDLDLALGNGDVSLSGALAPSDIYLNQLQQTGVTSFVRRPLDQDFGTASVALGDLDGDEDLDLVLGNHGGFFGDCDCMPGQESVIYRNNGDASFTFAGPITTPPVIGTVRSVALADVNGDGALDIVTANGRAPYGVNESGYRFRSNLIYLNRLDQAGRPVGAFDQASTRELDTRNNTQGLAVADMDGDSMLDIVAANPLERTVLYRNQQVAGFVGSAPLDFSETFQTEGLASGDLDGDGWLDLVAITEVDARVYRNNRDGTFAAPRAVYDGGAVLSLALGDLDRDGSIDIVLGRAGQTGVALLNGGDGQSYTARPFGPDDANFTAVALGDFDGDEWLDIAAGDGRPEQSRLFLNDGSGGFLAGQAVPGHVYPTTGLAAGDFDADGDLDLGASGRQSVVYLNDGTGTLSQTQTLTTTTGPAVFREGTAAVASADLDRDGDLDLAFGTYAVQSAFFRNDGAGAFSQSGQYYGETSATLDVAATDLNGDGLTDLVSANNDFSGLVAHLNDGDSLDRSFAVTTGGRAQAVAAGDFDRDGALDLAVLQADPGMIGMNVRVWWNNAHRWPGAPDDQLQVGVLRPGPTADAPFFSAPRVLADQVLPISYTLADQEGDPADVRAEYSLDGGGTWRPALATTETPTRSLTTRRAIPEQGSQRLELTIADPTPLADLDVTLSISHAAVGQLRAALIGPDGTSVELFGGVGGAGRNFAHTTFDDEAAGPLSAGSAPFSGRFQPAQSLAAFDGKVPAGTWTLEVNDTTPGTLGAVTGWSLTTTAVGEPLTLRPVPRPAPIPDPGEQTATIAIASAATISDVDVHLTIEHSYVSDLEVVLRGPDNTEVLLFGGVGEDGENVRATTLDDEAPAAIDEGSAPFSGRFRPQEQLSAFDGAATAGTWTLVLRDSVELDAGALLDWSISFATDVGPRTYTSPISQVIPDSGTATVELTSDTPGEITDVDVELSLAHAATGQLRGRLIGPDGSAVRLFESVGGAGANFTETAFDDEAGTPISAGAPPFTGSFQPQEPLSAFDGKAFAGTWRLEIGDTTAGTAGEITSWALRLATRQVKIYQSRTLPGVEHTFFWDIFASGVFGQSDTVLFRVIATPSLRPQPDRPAGSYQRPFAAAVTSPFRVRGSQVQVLDSQDQPVAEAIVLRAAGPAAQASFLADGAGTPYTTDGQGYLRGRGTIAPGDMLYALAPIEISPTAPYSLSATLYHTNMIRGSGGITGTAVVTAGVQTIAVAPSRPLILFHLDVALEWDARGDERYMAQLEYDLRRASEFLFDATNGQAALGDVNIWHDKENWDFAPIRVYASNRVRPSAVLGGIASEAISRTMQGGGELYFGPGQLRMGATWNRFGNAGSNLGEDWARTLTHELGHYLFFLDDNYLGYDTSDKVIQVTSCPGLMGDPYASLELRPDADWLEDSAGRPTCGQTFSHATYGRSDWATVHAFYPELVPPTVPFSDTAMLGPSTQPLSITTIISNEPLTPTTRLDVPIFYTRDTSGATYLASSRARAYLFQDSWGDEDGGIDRLTDLGRVTQDQILARGARAGDRLCLFDPAGASFGCETVTLGDETLTVRERADWRPDIRVTPVASETLSLSVTLEAALGAPLRARVFPLDNIAGPEPIVLTPGAPDASGLVTYTGTVTTPEPLAGAYVHVFVEEDGARREAVTSYAMGGNPGLLRSGGGRLRSGPGLLRSGGGRLRSGGGLLRSGGGLLRSGPGLLRSGGGLLRSGGAPVSSAEGDLLLVDDTLTFAEGQFLVIQSATALPPPPSWARLVGQGYRLTTSATAPDLTGGVLSFGYPGAEVPADEEAGITVYYSDGGPWEALETRVDTYHNLASAPSRGPGLYALMSSRQLAPLSVGWNLLAYPGATQPVAAALAHIGDAYTTVYGYEPGAADPWKVYGATVPAVWQPIVNDLEELSQGGAYWIRATRVITPLVRAPRPEEPGQAQTDQHGAPLSLPPATYYGELADVAAADASTVELEARIGGVLCGRATARAATLGGQERAVVVIDVRAVGPGADLGCGAAGRAVTFTFLRDGAPIGRRTMAWSNDEVLRLTDEQMPAGASIYLPMVSEGP